MVSALAIGRRLKTAQLRAEMAAPKKPSKYRNKPVAIDGHRFASQLEAKRYRELKLLERAGEIAELELQPRIPITINGRHVCTYVADFRYRDKRNGSTVHEDAKGVRTAVYRLKKALCWAVHGIEIKEIT